MTTNTTYRCNICQDEIDALTGVGFAFRSGRTEFEHGLPSEYTAHLCNRCIAATYDLSVSRRYLGED